MDCLEFRRLTLINPLDDHPARLAHQQECQGCAKFEQDLLAQDALIREATRIEVPEGFAARILLNHSLQPSSRLTPRPVWFAVAASVVLAAFLLQPVIDTTFYRPFENSLVGHMSKHDMLAHAGHSHAPHSQATHSATSSPEKIRAVLAAANTDLPSDIGNIIAATTCVINGELMAHLLVRHNDREFVVFVVPESSVVERTFSHDQWSGQLVNLNQRSLAVINHNGAELSAATEEFAALFGQSLDQQQTI